MLIRVSLLAASLALGCASSRSIETQRTDRELTREVESQLERSEEASAQDVDVEVRDRVVILLGEVQDERSRAEAKRIASTVPGVLAVDDRLEVVDFDPKAMIDPDSLITARISVEIAEDPLVRGRDIDVESIDRVVYLTGTVESEEAKRRATTIAKEIEDVDRVENLLTVMRPHDDELLDDDRVE